MSAPCRPCRMRWPAKWSGQAAHAAPAQAVVLATAAQAAVLAGIVAIPALRPRSLIVLKQPKSATAMIERTKGARPTQSQRSED